MSFICGVAVGVGICFLSDLLTTLVSKAIDYSVG